MKKWHLIVAGLYLLALGALTAPLFLAAGVPVDVLPKVFLCWPYWAVLGVMGAAQLLLLLVPVRVTSRRPLTRGALWPTVLVCSLFLALLGLAGALSLYAAIFGDNDAGLTNPWLYLAPTGALWLLWSIAFHRLARRLEPTDFVGTLCQQLLRGSILELLVAVPCHIVVRARDFCCAGILTLFGLAMGVSVMLFAFGPAVYFLFVARARRLQAAKPAQNRQA